MSSSFFVFENIIYVHLHFGGFLGDCIAHGDYHCKHVGDRYNYCDKKAEKRNHVVLLVARTVKILLLHILNVSCLNSFFSSVNSADPKQIEALINRSNLKIENIY